MLLSQDRRIKPSKHVEAPYPPRASPARGSAPVVKDASKAHQGVVVPAHTPTVYLKAMVRPLCASEVTSAMRQDSGAHWTAGERALFSRDQSDSQSAKVTSKSSFSTHDALQSTRHRSKPLSNARPVLAMTSASSDIVESFTGSIPHISYMQFGTYSTELVVSQTAL